MYSFTGYKGFKRELKPRADNQMHLTGMTISKEAGSLLFWSIKMCVKTMPMRLNISNDINNLGKVIRSFPNCLIIQQGRLFTSRKHSRQLPVFPGVDIPVSDCAVLRETVKKKTKKKQTTSRLYMPQLIKS